MQKFKSGILIGFVLLLFAGNIGIDIFKHICKKDGTSYSLFLPSHDNCGMHHNEEKPPCCSNKKVVYNENSVKEDCCNEEVKHLKISLDFFNNPLNLIAVLPNSLKIHFETKEQVVAPDLFIAHYINPPPKSGREILTIKQVFNI